MVSGKAQSIVMFAPRISADNYNDLVLTLTMLATIIPDNADYSWQTGASERR